MGGGFILCMTVTVPDESFNEPPEPELQVVPGELLDGLLSMVDNKKTADVRLICLEYGSESSLA